MNPLTANDLKVGGKYVVKLPTHSEVCEYFGVNSGGYLFKKCPIAYLLNEKEISTLVTPYHEPNQTTMNTDYTEQPFNLETALKHPEWVYFRNGEKPLEWHWFEKSTIGYPVIAINVSGWHLTITQDGKLVSGRDDDSDLILRVPYREVWVNIYPDKGRAVWSNSKEEADTNAAKTRIACGPVKIPATI